MSSQHTRHCEEHSFDAISGRMTRLPRQCYAFPRNDVYTTHNNKPILNPKNTAF
ncbi:hypothetical protein [Rickettsia endosymbiont of Seladonia tumulorum]|uniref:hypothetical protein n=1 Tax=Rickettsia endosymbiont of Seladonia tumulorum TaxID=3066270 RepID=UPI00313E5D9D